ncbi:hypothetical protein [Mesobacillus thioparans]|uniref:hypothetical protein n=1 Tax=Mesobacillus thioparans TaxID=370439 RepID=UPI0039EF5F9B
MERAAIFGVYDFVGYSLCRNLLDLGMEVEGIYPAREKEDHYTEEKRLEIGRNANFSEISLIDWQGEKAVDTVFVALFEAFLYQDRTQDYFEGLLAILESRQDKKQQTVLLLPAFMAEEKVNLKELHSGLHDLINNTKSSVLIIYLPTIFGPWQPEKFFFHKAMSQAERDKGEPVVDPWEWTVDCVYIDDVVEFIRKMAESGEQGQYLLASGEHDRWKVCARELLGQDPDVPESRIAKLKIKRAIKVKKVERNEEVSLGLSKQREQYSRIKDSRV